MKTLYFLLLSALLTACNITGKIESTGIQSLSFGTGGGFTNEIKTYTLMPDGTMWLHNSLTYDSAVIKNISKKEVNKMYSSSLSAGLDTLHYSNPGNIYSFITVVKNGASNKVVWEKNEAGLPEGVASLYSALSELTRKN